MKNIFETEMNVNAIDEMYETLLEVCDITEAVKDEMYMDYLDQFEEEIDDLYYAIRKPVKTNAIDEDEFDEAMLQLRKIIKSFFIERLVEKAIERHDYEVVMAAENYLESLGIHSRKAENGTAFDSTVMTVEYVEETTDNNKHKKIKEVSCPMYYYEINNKMKVINKMKTVVYKYEA